jgi:hypothetical protein
MFLDMSHTKKPYIKNDWKAVNTPYWNTQFPLASLQPLGPKWSQLLQTDLMNTLTVLNTHADLNIMFMLFRIKFVAHKITDLHCRDAFNCWLRKNIQYLLYRNVYIYFRIKFHIIGPSGSLVIAVIPKAAYRFRAAAILYYNFRLKK